MKRRHFLRSAVAVGSSSILGCNACGDGAAGPVAASKKDPVGPAPDLELTLRAAQREVSLFPGTPTSTWSFSADLALGSVDALKAVDASYLGPTLRLRRGQRVRVHLENHLSEPTVVHWHGLDVDQNNDGHPRFAVPAGGEATYDFEVSNRAGTYWYHPHPMDRTALQVYSGLAGLLIVSDDEEQRLSLPDGTRELLLVIQDRTFDGDNQFVYAPDRMLGFLGTDILVNGRRAETLEVPAGPHRLRILNGSNSRFYDLGWSDGTPLTVLGTDGGLLAAPRERAHVLLAPGQRLDLWASFGGGPGEDVWLESRAFSGVGSAMGMRGMGRRSGAQPGLPNGAPLQIQRFVATAKGAQGRPPPALADAADLVVGAAPASPSHRVDVSMRMMRWLLNGRSFEMLGVAENERVKLGAVEDWVFVNDGGGMMAMAHPIHMHGSPFTIVDRTSASDALHEGIFDEGLQDTFILLPGDSVRIRTRRARYPGLFLYHCHNLEHEDMGMMRNYLVEDA